MPPNHLHQKKPKTSNKLAWYILISFFIVTLIGVLYFMFFWKADAFYEKRFYEKISGIHIPSSSTVLESYDNGEYWTATAFKIKKDSVNQFIKNFDFQHSDSLAYRPKMFAESSFEIERLKTDSEKYLYNSGTKGKNNWLYIIDTTRSVLWAEIQYPDWAGN